MNVCECAFKDNAAIRSYVVASGGFGVGSTISEKNTHLRTTASLVTSLLIEAQYLFFFFPQLFMISRLAGWILFLGKQNTQR